MDWTEDHDVLFCREVIASDLFTHKPGSRERGACLEKIANCLNSLEMPWFKVDQRSLRDRIKKLLAQFTKKKNEEQRASGIDVEEKEIDGLLSEIYDLKHEQEVNINVENNEKVNKAEDEKKSADNLRRRSIERLSETRKRESLFGDEESPRKSTRSSGNSTISYLRKKSEKENSLREKELNIREQELKLNMRKQETLEKHNQLQSQALMLLIDKISR